MSHLVTRAADFAAFLFVVLSLACATGCGGSKAANAQSPPPPTLSAPVRPEPAAEPKATPANTTVVPAEDYAFLKDREAVASKPLPAVTAPPPALAPAAPAPAAAVPATKPDFYTMQKGDTLYGIARKFNISPRDLIAANNFRDPNCLAVGTKVKLP
jgi:membrane-bound lytic murein transglycosylase D